MRSTSLKLGLLLLSSAASCGGPEASAPAAVSGTTTNPATESWTCGGNLVPPTGWQQETAFRNAKEPTARESAAEDASSHLMTRLCGSDTGCEFLRSRIRKWKTGANATDVCAMAVISSEDLAEWRLTTSLEKLDEGLAAAAKALVGSGSSQRSVAIDRILDEGCPGGPRADWLKARMERHLQRHARVGSIPAGWAGDHVPPGLDVLIAGEIIQRTENQNPHPGVELGRRPARGRQAPERSGRVSRERRAPVQRYAGDGAA